MTNTGAPGVDCSGPPGRSGEETDASRNGSRSLYMIMSVNPAEWETMREHRRNQD